MREENKSVEVVTVCFSDCSGYTVDVFAVLCFFCPTAKHVTVGHQFTPSAETNATLARPSLPPTAFTIYVA